MITTKNPKEIQKMRDGGKILAGVLDELEQMVKPGLDLLDLEKKAAKLITEKGAKPSFKGYQGYPSILCLSVNEQVVHCIPRKRIVKEGDLVSIDCGVKYLGLFTDSARTVPAGNVSPEAQKLLNVTQEALKAGIKQVKDGNTVGDVGRAIQDVVEKQGLSVVKSLVGHGVGYAVHEDPRIPNYGEPKTGVVLREGMMICLEPMVNLGASEVDFSDDGWTVTTSDKSLSAHFEHTILVTKTGAEIITKK